MKAKLKKAFIVLLMLGITFWGYVLLVNRDSKNMTTKQKIMKAVYPAWMWWTRLTGKNTEQLDNKNEKQPIVSFYDLKIIKNDGTELNFSELRNKKVLLVNTASNCGYTSQYSDLEKIYEENKDRLIVIGFPANDFKEQEKGTDEEIAEFCKLNFGVTFPLVKKSVVVKSPDQHPVFQWLTDSSKNGWCNQEPGWNFTKYLVNEQGILVDYFGPSVSPASEDVKKAIDQ